ncbi:MAG: hypothetical protein KBC69_00240 [Candidatus Magasanikbacteria bacterium]|nr:hypothetical protein [Candidatus Magasanikbacteria bacterium]
MPSSTNLRSRIAKRLVNRRLFYVCRDIERATGDALTLNNYFIITNKTSFSQKIARNHSNIILISNKNQLDTTELLQHEELKKIIQPKDYIVVFKNNTIIESICRKNKWHLLNPRAELADTIESKVSQITWLGTLAKYLPRHTIETCQNIVWKNKKFILQFNHSHTGQGTFLIDTKNKLVDLQKKFPKRLVRTMDYINGPVFTNNNIVWDNQILIGNINYQITGLAPFTDNTFTTIGNDWSLAKKILSTQQIKEYKKIVREIGKKLRKSGWNGLFGTDIIMDQKTKKLYLLEINARQPASTTFESQLQKLALAKKTEGTRHNSDTLATTFMAHLAALLSIAPKKDTLITVDTGAQVIQRITSTVSQIKKLQVSSPAILQIIEYKNKTIGSDLVRIQSSQGIMEKHNSFNKIGKAIRASIC